METAVAQAARARLSDSLGEYHLNITRDLVASIEETLSKYLSGGPLLAAVTTIVGKTEQCVAKIADSAYSAGNVAQPPTLPNRADCPWCKSNVESLVESRCQASETAMVNLAEALKAGRPPYRKQSTAMKRAIADQLYQLSVQDARIKAEKATIAAKAAAIASDQQALTISVAELASWRTLIDHQVGASAALLREVAERGALPEADAKELAQKAADFESEYGDAAAVFFASRSSAEKSRGQIHATPSDVALSDLPKQRTGRGGSPTSSVQALSAASDYGRDSMIAALVEAEGGPIVVEAGGGYGSLAPHLDAAASLALAVESVQETGKSSLARTLREVAAGTWGTQHRGPVGLLLGRKSTGAGAGLRAGAAPPADTDARGVGAPISSLPVVQLLDGGSTHGGDTNASVWHSAVKRNEFLYNLMRRNYVSTAVPPRPRRLTCIEKTSGFATVAWAPVATAGARACEYAPHGSESVRYFMQIAEVPKHSPLITWLCRVRTVGEQLWSSGSDAGSEIDQDAVNTSGGNVTADSTDPPAGRFRRVRKEDRGVRYVPEDLWTSATNGLIVFQLRDSISPVRIRGLTPGATYVVSVASYNAVGPSKRSAVLISIPGEVTSFPPDASPYNAQPLVNRERRPELDAVDDPNYADLMSVMKQLHKLESHHHQVIAQNRPRDLAVTHETCAVDEPIAASRRPNSAR